jgi:hypothetical protein
MLNFGGLMQVVYCGIIDEYGIDEKKSWEDKYDIWIGNDWIKYNRLNKNNNDINYANIRKYNNFNIILNDNDLYFNENNDINYLYKLLYDDIDQKNIKKSIGKLKKCNSLNPLNDFVSHDIIQKKKKNDSRFKNNFPRNCKKNDFAFKNNFKKR